MSSRKPLSKRNNSGSRTSSSPQHATRPSSGKRSGGASSKAAAPRTSSRSPQGAQKRAVKRPADAGSRGALPAAPQQEARHLLPDDVRNDISGVAIAVIAIALFIAVVAPGDALLSTIIRDALLYGFGVGGYLIPAALLAWALSFFVRSGYADVIRTGIGLTLIVIAVLAILALFTPGVTVEQTAPLFAASALIGRGGYMGAGIAWLLVMLVGTVIGTVIMVGLIITGLVVIGLSISGMVARSRSRFQSGLAAEEAHGRGGYQGLGDFSGDGTVAFDANGDVIPGTPPASGRTRVLRGDLSDATRRISDAAGATIVLPGDEGELSGAADGAADPTGKITSILHKGSASTTKRTALPAQTPAVVAITPSGEGVHASDAPTVDGDVPEVEMPFILPDPRLVSTSSPKGRNHKNDRECRDLADRLQETLNDFSLDAKVVGWVHGPSVTQFKVEMPVGVRVSKITGLQDDIALSLAASSVRVFAPIPGTSFVGVEIPNANRDSVTLGDVLGAVKEDDGPLTLALGRDVEGDPILADLAKMPHLLIAGTTGSGKSVAINSMLMSILMRATPSEVRMVLVDPKRVELSVYNGIPHLYVPVVTEPGEAASALAWGVAEMEKRFKRIQKAGTRNIGFYNQMVREGTIEDDDADPMPYLVIVIDELADLMMQCGKEVEQSICRIAQLGRAAGIHLVVATQRPSTNIVTGLIKANITNRIAFKVSSGTDSFVILDQRGAERLLGNGDMLFSKTEWGKPRRIQGCFVKESEIAAVVDHLKQQGEPDYHEEILKMTVGTGYTSTGDGDQEDDPLVWEAADAVVSMGFGSTSGLQRRLKVGYARAGRIMDMLESKGIVGPPDGSKPREVLVDQADLESLHAFEQHDEEM